MTTETPVLLTIFGGTGDLAQRKLYPAIFRLFQKHQLQQHFAVIGTARRDWSHEYYRQVVRTAIASLTNDAAEITNFTSHFYYQSHDVNDVAHYQTLKSLSQRLDQQYRLRHNRLFYLAMAPNFFETIAQHLKSEQLLTTDGFNRLIIEKPFGHNYSSAEKLNKALTATFRTDQIFRIDHYLGKSMIQNITNLRFNNQLEALWNHHFIDNIQITLSEQLGVADRAIYYDQSGALRDMVQNHILQILSLLAMEQPAFNNHQSITIAKQTVLEQLHPLTAHTISQNFIRGQYAGAEHVKAYRQNNQISADSNNDSFVAGKITIDNPRWQGVPFYIRTGKELAAKYTRINVQFRTPAGSTAPANRLTINVEPEATITSALNIQSERPTVLKPVSAFAQNDAYANLLQAILHGDATHFTTWEELAAAWKFIDPIQAYWDTHEPEFPNYQPQTMGPQAATDLLTRDGRTWLD